MAKKAKVWDGSAWQDLVNATQDLTPYSTTAQMNTAIAAAVPIVPVIPTSVAVGSGSGSYNSSTGLVTFSGASSVSLNGVFSSTYTKYHIIFNSYAASAAEILCRLRTGGTDNSSTTYSYGIARATSNATFAMLANSDGASNIRYFSEDYGLGANWENMSIVEVLNPYQSKVTSLINNHVIAVNTGGNTQRRFGSAHFGATTSFDGITIYAAANLTGTVKVMAYV